ncbi:hypothetical protein, partial [Burkholderia sp. Ap-962]|uniref:hypothetical protein n=1 Tax=Burkholderia sp. Ap-962 TaxID=2608333 RepID=UPI00141DEB74
AVVADGDLQHAGVDADLDVDGARLGLADLATRLPADRAFDSRAAERFRRRAIRSARWERRPGRPRRPLL